MSDITITVDDVSKIFRIYDKPSDRLREAFSFHGKKYYTDFPALKNISFSVRKGEFLGIVGKNGAGKSTLLKILSGELTPSSGSVTINGNVSLLQLGVGFDPELTGIENARFASKLLGYTNAEIKSMLEDIITFADIGEFINHPVKTYSSGMYSRLSFAVGVNINPDILIADEVLAVGDMRFAQKCLRKMREFKEKGKTVVLVTHDTSTVNVFCDTALWLKEGKLFQSGDAKTVATNYTNFMLYDMLPEEYRIMPAGLSNNGTNGITSGLKKTNTWNFNSVTISWQDLTKLKSIGDGRAEIQKLAFLLKDNLQPVTTIKGNETLLIIMDVMIKGYIEHPQIGIRINNVRGLVVVHTNNDNCKTAMPPVNRGERLIAKFEIKLPSISNGNYILSVGLQDDVGTDSTPAMPQLIEDVYEFVVNRNDLKSTQCGYVLIEDQNFEIVS